MCGHAARHIAVIRGNTYALLDDLMLWLQEEGFRVVDCVYRNFKMGVFLGVKGSLK